MKNKAVFTWYKDSGSTKNREGKRVKKSLKLIVAVILLVIALACLIGLIVTGYMIGWGPFAQLRYYNKVDYQIADVSCDYTRERREIKGPNGTIVGYLFTPQDAEPGPLIILSHGLATEQWHNLNTANSLACAGLRVFIFDYCGGSIHAESDGKTTDMSVLTEKADLNAVLDEAKTWDGVTGLGVIGYSQGGLVAAMAAVERDDIDRLCLLYPAFAMFDQIQGSYRSAEDIPQVSDRAGMQVGQIYYADILFLPFDDIYAYVAQYEGSVMIQHGTQDMAVPYSSSQTAAESYENCTFFTLPGAGHGFTGEDDILSVQKEYEFFTKSEDIGGEN